MHQRFIIDSAARLRLLASYPAREFVDAAGLISYAVDYPDRYLRLVAQVVKIFKGSRPGDIPIGRPTKVELTINLATAQALGLTVSQSLLLRADRLVR